MSSIVVRGFVATTPRHLVTQDGLAITSFRIAEENDGTEIVNWYTVTAFRQLAINTAGSVNKGDRVIVSGAIQVRDWDNGERAGTSVEIGAEAIGHDLFYGNSVYTRTQDTPKHSCDCDKCDK